LANAPPSGNFVEEPAVDAGNRHRPTLCTGENRGSQGVRAIGFEHYRYFDTIVQRVERSSVRFHSNGINSSFSWASLLSSSSVSAPPFRSVSNRSGNIVKSDHATSTQQEHTPDRELTHERYR
jgi:hypothetical protein